MYEKKVRTHFAENFLLFWKKFPGMGVFLVEIFAPCRWLQFKLGLENPIRVVRWLVAPLMQHNVLPEVTYGPYGGWQI